MSADDRPVDIHVPAQRPPFEETNAIVSLIARLKPENPVRRIALSLIRGEPLEEGRPLLSALRNPSAPLWREGEVAAWVLGRAPLSTQDRAAATEKLLEVLERAERERIFARFWRGTVRSYFAAAMVGFLCSSGLYIFGPARYMDPWPIVFAQMATTLGTIVLPFGLTISWNHDRMLYNRVRAASAAALGRLGAIDSIGALAGALFDHSDRVREAAALALHELLPRLTPEDYGVLGAQSMIHLGRGLQHSDTQLVFQILQALEGVGTSHAIPAVERVANRGRTTRLKDAAAHVLETLRGRQHLENQKDRLLRATTGPQDPAAALLRPAGESAEIDARLLLRASGTDE